MPMGRPARYDGKRPKRRWPAALAAGLACISVLAAFLVLRFADSLGPLDLSATAESSTIVLDREARLLRPFATPEGRWRLPVGVDDVDPRLVAMLKAYEDGRFDVHPGVDALALARAAGQILRH